MFVSFCRLYSMIFGSGTCCASCHCTMFRHLACDAALISDTCWKPSSILSNLSHTPLARNQHINHSPGAFSCIRTEINSPKIFISTITKKLNLRTIGRLQQRFSGRFSPHLPHHMSPSSGCRYLFSGCSHKFL